MSKNDRAEFVHRLSSMVHQLEVARMDCQHEDGPVLKHDERVTAAVAWRSMNDLLIEMRNNQHDEIRRANR